MAHPTVELLTIPIDKPDRLNVIAGPGTLRQTRTIRWWFGGWVVVLASARRGAGGAIGPRRALIRVLNAPGGVATTFADGIAEMARRQAASMSPDELAAVFAVTAPDAVAAVEKRGRS